MKKMYGETTLNHKQEEKTGKPTSAVDAEGKVQYQPAERKERERHISIHFLVFSLCIVHVCVGAIQRRREPEEAKAGSSRLAEQRISEVFR